MDLNTLIIPFFLLVFSNFPCNKATSTNCSISKCGDSSGGNTPAIRFPFRIKSRPGQEPSSCGRSGFDVWCDERSKHTLIELPRSGNFKVKSIDYAAQEMWVNDPNKCLPKRLLTFNILDSSPFGEVYHQDFSFFNCSNTLNNTSINNNDDDDTNFTHLKGLLIVGPIKCLSGSNHFVYAMPTNGTTFTNHTSNLLSPLNCSLVAPLIKVPVQWPPSLHNDHTVLSLLADLHGDLRLSWYIPECRPCELNGQMCALETASNDSDVIICSDIPNEGIAGKLPLTTFIAVILVICAPSIICIVGSIVIWIRHCYKHRRSNRNTQTGPVDSNGPTVNEELGQLAEVNIEFARHIVRMGLNEEANLDRRPTVVISEMEEVGLGQGPNRENDNMCAICMGEYRRKDRIGTLPSCEHYFHANCINKWLLSRGRFGKTCPICRAPVDSL